MHRGGGLSPGIAPPSPGPIVLVVVPSRELAQQIADQFEAWRLDLPYTTGAPRPGLPPTGLRYRRWLAKSAATHKRVVCLTDLHKIVQEEISLFFPLAKQSHSLPDTRVTSAAKILCLICCMAKLSLQRALGSIAFYAQICTSRRWMKLVILLLS